MVVSAVSRFIREVRLVSLYPCIGVYPGKVPVELTQFLDETVCAQIAIALGVELYDRNEGGVYVCCAWHNHLTKVTVYIYSIAKYEGRSSGCQVLNSMYTKTLKFYLLMMSDLKDG